MFHVVGACNQRSDADPDPHGSGATCPANGVKNLTGVVRTLLGGGSSGEA